MNLEHVLHNESELVILLEWLRWDGLSDTTSVTQSVVQRRVEAVEERGAGSLALTVVNTPVEEGVVDEVEAEDGVDPDDDDHEKGSKEKLVNI